MEKAREHPYLAFLLDLLVMSALVRSLFWFAGSSGFLRAFLHPGSPAWVVAGLLLSAIPVLFWHAGFASKSARLSPGEIIAGKIVRQGKKFWNNPWAGSRASLFVMLGFLFWSGGTSVAALASFGRITGLLVAAGFVVNLWLALLAGTGSRQSLLILWAINALTAALQALLLVVRAAPSDLAFHIVASWLPTAVPAVAGIVFVASPSFRKGGDNDIPDRSTAQPAIFLFLALAPFAAGIVWGQMARFAAMSLARSYSAVAPKNPLLASNRTQTAWQNVCMTNRNGKILAGKVTVFATNSLELHQELESRHRTVLTVVMSWVESNRTRTDAGNSAIPYDHPDMVSAAMELNRLLEHGKIDGVAFDPE